MWLLQHDGALTGCRPGCPPGGRPTQILPTKGSCSAGDLAKEPATTHAFRILRAPKALVIGAPDGLFAIPFCGTVMAAFPDRSSVKPVRLVSESARERETFE